MSFSRANKLGFVAQPIMFDRVLNRIDSNLARAADGASGGTYEPRTELAINGNGLASDSISATIGPGATLMRHADGFYPLRVTAHDWTTITELDTTADLHIGDGTALVATRDIIMQDAITLPSNPPQHGDTIRISRPLNGLFGVRLYTGTIAPANLRAFLPATYTAQVGGSPFFVSFYYTIQTQSWEVLQTSNDVS
jgi:hypothetical protein